LRRVVTPAFATDVIVSAVLPWVAVLVLGRAGVPVLTALAIATVFPLARGAVSLLRRHRVDAIGAINLAFLAGSIAVSFLTNDVHFVLLRGVLVTSAFSLLCLGSLAAPRPLMFLLARQLATRDDPAAEAAFNARWERPPFRRAMRTITLVWGAAWALEVVARVLVAYRLPTLAALAVAPALTYGTLVLLVAWTIGYSAAQRRKHAAQPAVATA
jgi:hypothetical protein